MAFIEQESFYSCANLFLCVSSFNLHAQRFYRRLGYEQVGVLKNYLVEGHEEILMRKSIAPILERDRLNKGCTAVRYLDLFPQGSFSHNLKRSKYSETFHDHFPVQVIPVLWRNGYLLFFHQ